MTTACLLGVRYAKEGDCIDPPLERYRQSLKQEHRFSRVPGDCSDVLILLLVSCLPVAGENASRDIMRLVATLMVLFRLFGWLRATTFANRSLVSVLQAVVRRDTDVMPLSHMQPHDIKLAVAGAQFCLQVCCSGVTTNSGGGGSRTSPVVYYTCYFTLLIWTSGC